MLISDKIMETFSKSPGKTWTIQELAVAIGSSEQHVRTGINVLLAGKDIVAAGKRHGHGRCAAEYRIVEKEGPKFTQ